MSEIVKFPSRGVIRDDEGEAVGFYQGYTEEQALAFKAKNELIMRAMPTAQRLAEERGYESLFDMPDEERFALVDEAVHLISPANNP